MAKPLVVIVGRPNVGKSTLFNRMVGRSAAIVEDVPGVTRDLNYLDAEWEGKPFVAVDTGGFYPRHDENIFVQIKEQALFAVQEADVVIHLLDAKDGLNPFDAELAALLRGSGKGVLWAVNKVDTSKQEPAALEFYSLGISEPVPVSAATGYNFDELMEKVAALLPEPAPEEAREYPKVAVLGRPNVGKSTLVNALLGKKRLLVSPVPGTTRDAIDTLCTYYGRKYLLIDTAGIRRKDTRGYSIERFAMVRTLRSIERADVCLVLIDAAEGIVAEDQKIAGLVHSRLKGAVFVLNKWDLVTEHDKVLAELMKTLGRKLWFFAHAPVLTASSLERTRITKVFPLVDQVMEARRTRIPTAELNRFAQDISLPPHKGRKVKIHYMTQVAVEPPAFTLFTNFPEGIKPSSLRHVEARLRKAYPAFAGTPLRFFKKPRK
ncbi:MAG: ribosome biogenesis GTPase Der [Nitrospirota bacterium]|jgi:GTP-binding protein